MATDVIVRTSENHLFKLYKVILKLVSPIFGDAIDFVEGRTGKLPPSDLRIAEISDDGVQIFGISEVSQPFDTVMRLCYPLADPAPGGFNDVRDALEVATKYRLAKATNNLKLHLEGFLDEDPLRVYAVACRYGYESLARNAAESCLAHPIIDVRFQELDHITAAEYMRLLPYHREANSKLSGGLFDCVVLLWRRNGANAFPAMPPFVPFSPHLRFSSAVLATPPSVSAKLTVPQPFRGPGDVTIRSLTMLTSISKRRF